MVAEEKGGWTSSDTKMGSRNRLIHVHVEGVRACCDTPSLKSSSKIPQYMFATLLTFPLAWDKTVG